MDIDYRWQGAEAKVGLGKFFGKTAIYKERVKKTYRHPQLDARLTSKRIIQEVRCMVKARRNGIRTPAIMLVDVKAGRFVMEYIEGPTLKAVISRIEDSGPDNAAEGWAQLEPLARQTGIVLAKLHNLDTIHGDLTTSNLLLSESPAELVLIDFGLSYGSNLVEDKAVDLYVLERAIASTHPQCAAQFFRATLDAYREHVKNPKQVLSKLADVQLRGRKREMIG